MIRPGLCPSALAKEPQKEPWAARGEQDSKHHQSTRVLGFYHTHPLIVTLNGTSGFPPSRLLPLPSHGQADEKQYTL